MLGSTPLLRHCLSRDGLTPSIRAIARQLSPLASLNEPAAHGSRAGTRTRRAGVQGAAFPRPSPSGGSDRTPPPAAAEEFRPAA